MSAAALSNGGVGGWLAEHGNNNERDVYIVNVDEPADEDDLAVCFTGYLSEANYSSRFATTLQHRERIRHLQDVFCLSRAHAIQYSSNHGGSTKNIKNGECPESDLTAAPSGHHHRYSVFLLNTLAYKKWYKVPGVHGVSALAQLLTVGTP